MIRSGKIQKNIKINNQRCSLSLSISNNNCKGNNNNNNNNNWAKPTRANCPVTPSLSVRVSGRDW